MENENIEQVTPEVETATAEEIMTAEEIAEEQAEEADMPEKVDFDDAAQPPQE